MLMLGPTEPEHRRSQKQRPRRTPLRSMICKTKSPTISPSLSIVSRNPSLYEKSKTHHLRPTSSPRKAWPSVIKYKWEELRVIRGKKLLKDLSTWGIGGPCGHFLQVFTCSQLLSALRYCDEHSMPFIIVGQGSNCLFDDLGYDGCVIQNRIEFVEREEETGIYRAGSGFPFNRLGVRCSGEGYTGLEFAAGIPGTVGGAVYMNAGANGQETAGVVHGVEFVTRQGMFQRLDRTDLHFGYRSSSFQDMKNLAAIVAVTFQLRPSSSASATTVLQQQYLERRRLSQPVRERSAGSVFRNPPNLGVTAGELIERAGLKGYRVGGAMVSHTHANFFINSGQSTSRDMLELIQLVKEKVYQRFGVELKEEVLYVHPHGNVQN